MAWVEGAAVDWTLSVDHLASSRDVGGSPARPLSATRLDALREADDNAVLDAWMAGQTEAFDVIVERYRRRVYLVCYRFAGGHEDASDYAQETLVRAFRGLRRFRRQASLSTWLHRIAVNVCLSRLGAKTIVTESIESERFVDTRGDSPADGVLRNERAAQLRTAIARLPRRQRSVVILRVYQDLSHEEIAQILGSSVGAVKVNFCHALATLRGVLGPAASSGAKGPS
jgi:RNA polymerase sigma-70 factor (ECF subfamily)